MNRENRLSFKVFFDLKEIILSLYILIIDAKSK